jgi:hypothetical protein
MGLVNLAWTYAREKESLTWSARPDIYAALTRRSTGSVTCAGASQCVSADTPQPAIAVVATFIIVAGGNHPVSGTTQLAVKFRQIVIHRSVHRAGAGAQ